MFWVQDSVIDLLSYRFRESPECEVNLVETATCAYVMPDEFHQQGNVGCTETRGTLLLPCGVKVVYGKG